MISIAVLASGRGSNFEAILLSIGRQELQARIVALISDQPKAPALSLARAHGVPTVVIPRPKKSDQSPELQRIEHDTELLKVLSQLNPRFLVLAGYQRIVTSRLIEAFRSERGYSRIVNIHPSLLPSFPGLHSYSKAYQYGVKVTGVTIHLVEAQVDSGPICAQEAFSIADCVSEVEVEQRGLQIEHRLFPQTLRWVLSENFRIERRLGGSLDSQGSRELSEMRICVCTH